MELTGHAHGKLLLFGEHAVVVGHPALGLTLPLTTRLSWISSDRTVDHEYIYLMEDMLGHLGSEVQPLWTSRHWQVQIDSVCRHLHWTTSWRWGVGPHLCGRHRGAKRSPGLTRAEPGHRKGPVVLSMDGLGIAGSLTDKGDRRESGRP